MLALKLWVACYRALVCMLCFFNFETAVARIPDAKWCRCLYIWKLCRSFYIWTTICSIACIWNAGFEIAELNWNLIFLKKVTGLLCMQLLQDFHILKGGNAKFWCRFTWMQIAFWLACRLIPEVQVIFFLISKCDRYVF